MHRRSRHSQHRPARHRSIRHSRHSLQDFYAVLVSVPDALQLHGDVSVHAIHGVPIEAHARNVNGSLSHTQALVGMLVPAFLGMFPQVGHGIPPLARLRRLCSSRSNPNTSKQWIHHSPHTHSLRSLPISTRRRIPADCHRRFIHSARGASPYIIIMLCAVAVMPLGHICHRPTPYGPPLSLQGIQLCRLERHDRRRPSKRRSGSCRNTRILSLFSPP